MKMNKLLAGVAAVALTTGAANAQGFFEINQRDGGVGSAPNLSGTPVVGDVWFASELGSLAGVTVPLEFDIEPANTGAGTEVFASSANVEGLLKVTVSNAVLDRSLTAGDMVGTGACAGQAFSVASGGAAGQSTVTFRIPDLQVCDTQDGLGGDAVSFGFPILLSGGNVDVDFELRRASNNALIGTGSWSDGNNNAVFQPTLVSPLSGGPLIRQVPALVVTTAEGVAVADSTAVPAFTAFTGPGNLGAFNVSTTGAYIPGAAPPSLVATGAANVAAGELLCTFASGTGLNATGHIFGTLANTATTSTSNPVPFTFTSGQVGATHTFALAATGTFGIQPQNVSCAGSVSFTPASGLSDFTISSFSLGRIRRDGPTTGFFEWVGDSTLSTGNVFRVTGLGATAPTASVIVNNSSTGMDGEYVITLPTPTNGEVIINNAWLTNRIGNFGRADLQFSFHSDALKNDGTGAGAAAAAAGQGVVVRRFMVGSNGTLFDMGNDNDDANGARSGPIGAANDTGGGNN
jgi:hypothetical protein